MPERKKPPGKRKRGPKGTFLPGNREGPGRPKGSRNKTTLMIEALLEDEAQELTRALIRRAKAGYAGPLQIVFDRLAPARKDRHVQIKLPPITTLGDVVVAHGTLIQHVADGELTPIEAHSVATLLELRRRALESVELEARIAAIEASIAQQGGSQ